MTACFSYLVAATVSFMPFLRWVLPLYLELYMYMPSFTKNEIGPKAFLPRHLQLTTAVIAHFAHL